MVNTKFVNSVNKNTGNFQQSSASRDHIPSPNIASPRNSFLSNQQVLDR